MRKGSDFVAVRAQQKRCFMKVGLAQLMLNFSQRGFGESTNSHAN
jgi:hypothetical protein